MSVPGRALRQAPARLVAAGAVSAASGAVLLLAGAAYADPPADPPGKNGTVKIVGEDDVDATPENNPHQSCRLAIEWYDLDEGDLDSTVTFTMWKPTDEVELTVDGPTSDFVGEDSAAGGRDLDARAWYTLHPVGEALPQQGYHVKVTVSTPGIKGPEEKTKVVWVTGCETAPTETTRPEEEPTQHVSGDASGDSSMHTSAHTGGSSSTAAVAGSPAQSSSTVTVAVPAVVDAGLTGSTGIDADLTGSTTSHVQPANRGLLLGGALAAAGGAGVLARRRGAGAHRR